MHACIRMLVAGVIALAVLAIGTGGATAAASDGRGPEVAAEASGNGAARGSDRAHERRQDPSDTAAVGANDVDTTDVHTGPAADLTEPQPLSTADAHEGGANGDCPGGPYCSTRDGSASENGAGAGKAIGKPCAGCVGKADNKNPHGQLPDGRDHNAGYECDRNRGIGKGNPAHTGCTPTPVEAPAAQPLVEQPPEEEPPGAVLPPVVITTGGVLPPAETTTSGVLPGKPVAPARPRLEAAGVLPATGSQAMLGGLLLAGLALVGSGAVVLLRRAHG